MAPSSSLVRALLPVMQGLLKLASIRRFATVRIARIKIRPTTAPTEHVSWSHARIEWASGETRQGWMRTGEAMAFTAEVMAQVSLRLLDGQAARGVYTPGALFGADLARACGAEIILGAP